MDPVTASLIIGGLGALGGIGKSANESKARKEEAKLTREKLAQDKDLSERELALQESIAGLFRDQLSQAGAVGRLDMMERGDFGPRYATPTSAYAHAVPSGPRPSFYTPSDELRAVAAALKRNVMAGNATPSQAVAGNKGRTGALNLLPIIAGRMDAAAPEAFATGAAARPGVSGARGVTPRASLKTRRLAR